MSNVIPFSSRSRQQTPAATPAEEERAALAADLIEMIDRVRELTERVVALPGPGLQVEQTAQHLLDAATALECATEALTEGGEWVPF
ncbi:MULTISPECIES: hypothetical protein [Microvirga]|uniref:hypothetical protein n=1 Tax=Microvirga TaxID=186650 RepID=UPI001D000AB0|nr:hypothetical protein [Microvirga lenta]MCB5174987.1 hypothetical protein [Microvirga lenta]